MRGRFRTIKCECELLRGGIGQQTNPTMTYGGGSRWRKCRSKRKQCDRNELENLHFDDRVVVELSSFNKNAPMTSAFVRYLRDCDVSDAEIFWDGPS